VQENRVTSSPNAVHINKHISEQHYISIHW